MTFKEEVNKIIYDRSKKETILTKDDLIAINYKAQKVYPIKHSHLKVVFNDTYDYRAMAYINKPLIEISLSAIELDVINYLNTLEKNNPYKYQIINAEILAIYLHEISHLEHYKKVESDNTDFDTNYTKIANDPLFKINQLDSKIEEATTTKERRKLIAKFDRLYDSYYDTIEVDLAENMADYDGYNKLINLLSDEKCNKKTLTYLKNSLLKEVNLRYKIATNHYQKPSPFNVFHDSFDTKEVKTITSSISENQKEIENLTIHEKLRYGLPINIPIEEVTTKNLFKAPNN